MTKRIKIIGIGAGDPNYLTVQAIDALNEVDVFFLMDKGPSKDKLISIRREICRRFIRPDRAHRFVDAASPERERDAADYAASIDDLNARKQAVFERLIGDELRDGECGGFLTWGDPALYDSTIRIVGDIADSGRHEIDWEVIPGVTSLQALAAKHRTTLNTVGRAVEITTGRRLKGFSEDADTIAVMLDAEHAYRRLQGEDVEIFWGAYVGTEDEILVSGRLSEVADEIERVRTEARARHGWIMDSYLLRKRSPEA
ncbi:precorrin-6A synthase (deacetylating) [Methylopila henanensis]|uniref:Precorrin-6A synthase [deacetylating] n=1 Tax=Methylopila henanensis TaxID=873516 RepID=A0ABW4K1R9_9HYPH